jgi:hypothetical protein
MTETTEPPPAAKPKKKYNLAEKKITKKITDWLKTLEGCWYYKVSFECKGGVQWQDLSCALVSRIFIVSTGVSRIGWR